jgi:hypothetical protein
MRSFLKGRKLWLYVIGEVKKPVKGASETDEAFTTRLIDWDSNHHKILTWFHNTTIPSISALFGNFDEAKDARAMLASRYSSVDGAHEYQLLFEPFHLRQEPSQSINDFLPTCNFYGAKLMFLTLFGRILLMLRCMLHTEINIAFTNF